MAKTFTLNGHAYGYQGLGGKAESWSYSASGSVNGASTLSHELNRAVGGGASSRQNWKLVVPVLATEDSACACDGAVLRKSTLDLTFNTSNASTTSERTEILDQLDDLIADADFRAAFVAGAFLG